MTGPDRCAIGPNRDGSGEAFDLGNVLGPPVFLLCPAADHSDVNVSHAESFREKIGIAPDVVFDDQPSRAPDLPCPLANACGGALVASGVSTTDDELIAFMNGPTMTTYAVRVFVPASSSGDCNNYNMTITAEPPGPCFGLPDDSLEENDDTAGTFITRQ